MSDAYGVDVSLNDTMAAYIGELVPFGGEMSRVRCILHITNLVAKSMMKLFDVPKKRSWGHGANKSSSHGSSDDEHKVNQGGPSTEDGEGDNVEGWVDETEQLMGAKHKRLEEAIHPLWMILVKVSTNEQRWTYHWGRSAQIRKLSFKVIHSTTLLLPAWVADLKDLDLPVKKIPCDCWTIQMRYVT